LKITEEVERMEYVACPKGHGPAEVPEEGKWVAVREIKDISGLSHGIGWCAPQQGCCKLTLNVKDGIIEEALVETTGCTGATHGAAVACEHLTGKTLLEGLNTHLACDAINMAMKNIFMQYAYGRTQTAFSEGGLPVGASLEDLGKSLCSQGGTVFSTREKGVRYLEMAEGYILDMALNEEREVTGYRYVNTGKMMDAIRNGADYKEAYEKNIGVYGQYADAAAYIDPRRQ
jgi:NifU-like protein involved in Fe-S cluster formation